MFIAVDENKNRVVADDATRDTKYFCPVSRTPPYTV